jgi:S1-C subfamily serine protease
MAVASLLLAAPASASSQIYRRLLQSTGWVVVPGKGKMAAGTCFVVDRERRLVVTCQHVVGDAPEALVYFPAYDKDKVVVDSEHYLNRVAAISGKVLARDGPRDLALIRLDSLPEGVKELPLAAEPPDPGEDVHSLGNSGVVEHGVLWRYTRGDVRLSYEKKVRTAEGVRRVLVLETQAPVNKGDSGGPVVNDRGQVVGVASSFANDERLVTGNTDVREVKKFLDEARAARDDTARKPAEVAVAETKPAEPNRSPVGRWNVTVRLDGSKAGAGTGQFKDDKTVVLTLGPPDKDPQTRSGRFAYANGVLWLILDDKTTTAPVTWAGADHFTFKSGKAEFVFDRQEK